MKSLFNFVEIDWLILSRFKGFIWGIWLWLLFLILFLSFIYYTPNLNLDLAFLEDSFRFPIVYNTASIFALFPSQLLCILQIILICRDFTFKHYRLFITNGVSRNKLILRNIIFSLLLSLFMSFVLLIIATFFGFIAGGTFTSHSISWVGVFLIQMFFYLIYSTAIGVVIRDVGIASFVYVIWFGIVERIIAQIINYKLNLYPLGNLLPGKVIENKITFMTLQNITHTTNDLSPSLDYGMTFFWLAIALFIIKYSYQKIRF